MSLVNRNARELPVYYKQRDARAHIASPLLFIVTDLVQVAVNKDGFKAKQGHFTGARQTQARGIGPLVSHLVSNLF